MKTAHGAGHGGRHFRTSLCDRLCRRLKLGRDPGRRIKAALCIPAGSFLCFDQASSRYSSSRVTIGGGKNPATRLRPRDGLGYPIIQPLQPPLNLNRPRRFGIVVDPLVEALDQLPSERGTFLVGQKDAGQARGTAIRHVTKENHRGFRRLPQGKKCTDPRGSRAGRVPHRQQPGKPRSRTGTASRPAARRPLASSDDSALSTRKVTYRSAEPIGAHRPRLPQT